MKDYFGYQGKVAVVTGAASGMAKAAAECLVDMGAEVYALDLVEADVPGIKKSIVVNVGEKESIDKAFAALPDKIDKFFGIAGVSGLKCDYDTAIRINYVGNKYMLEEHLARRVVDGGAIGFITSSAGMRWYAPELREEMKALIEPKGWDATMEAIRKHIDEKMLKGVGAAGYVLTKRLINYYVAAVAVPEFGKRHVRVNCVLPAPTQSGMTDDFITMKGGKVEALHTSDGFAGRLAESREQGNPLVFLCSDMASFISGVMLDVDFGFNSQILAGNAPDPLGAKMLSK